MTFEIDLNGRTRTISIERRSDAQYRVLLDGEPERGLCRGHPRAGPDRVRPARR